MGLSFGQLAFVCGSPANLLHSDASLGILVAGQLPILQIIYNSTEYLCEMEFQ